MNIKNYIPIILNLILIVFLTTFYLLSLGYIKESANLPQESSYIVTFIFGMIIMALIASFIRELNFNTNNGSKNESIQNININYESGREGKVVFTDESSDWKTKGFLFSDEKKFLGTGIKKQDNE